MGLETQTWDIMGRCGLTCRSSAPLHVAAHKQLFFLLLSLLHSSQQCETGTGIYFECEQKVMRY